MPRFEPFAGLRYSPAVPLERVISPPYDVVSPEERVRLAARHPANAIHVELPAADESAGLDPYTHAARLLHAWVQEGTLVRDGAPAYYGYRMVTPQGRTTTGVIGALGLEPPGGDVLPHEQTIPKDKTDRLELLRACRANLSPIWGLSLGSGLSALVLHGDVPGTGPGLASAVDDDGVRHDIWRIDDDDRIDALTDCVESSPVVLADGHHRYETALTFARESTSSDRTGSPAPGGSVQAGSVASPAVRARGAGEGSVMALVVELAEDQITVGPIHRTLVGVAPGVDVAAEFSRFFDLMALGTATDALLADLAASYTPALVWDGRAWLRSARPDATELAGSDLDSSVVAMTVDAIPGATAVHRHSWREAVQPVRTGEADAAVLMRPPSVDQIASWARARRRMPPKSTYFFPKPRTGMVIRPLDP